MTEIARLGRVRTNDLLACWGERVIFGHVTVHDYTVRYFHVYYYAILEQILKYAISRMRFSALRD